MLGVVALQQASAFSIFGPLEAFQTPTLDYGNRYYYHDGELGGPKNFGEGSRLNVPIVTYGYDSTFLEYFGTKGVAAIDGAIAIMNRLPVASQANLSGFLTQGNEVVNYTAGALNLADLKSTVMTILLEHMGLIGETHIWDLHDRVSVPPGGCLFEYSVINRNYDPVTYNPSAYVNGVQYTYSIWEGCSNGVQVADAIEQPADQTSPAQYAFTAVASGYGLQYGGFYLGITRDDMGGLKYLYRHNNYAYESLDSNSIALGSISAYSPVNPFGGFGATNGFQGILGGVEKITYVKVAYDSLIGTAFTPKRYSYTIPFVTNNTLKSLRVTRTIIRPDILFTAGDLDTNQVFPLTPTAYVRGFGYISNGIVSANNGVSSSVISPIETVTFNTVNNLYYNESPYFMDQTQFYRFPVFNWGSFDGSTNAPVLYPNGSSIASLEGQLLQGGPSITLGLYNPVSFTTNTTTTTGTIGQ